MSNIEKSIPIESLLNDVPYGHSDFQCDNFITKKAGGFTLWGQYKQALLELATRYTGFMEYVVNLKTRKLDIEKEELELEKWKIEQTLNNPKLETIEIDSKLFQIELKKREISLNMKKHNYEDFNKNFLKANREFLRFYAHCSILKTKLLKKYGELTEDVKKQLEDEFWTNDAYVVAIKTWNDTQDVNKVTDAVMKLENFQYWPEYLRKKVVGDLYNAELMNKKIAELNASEHLVEEEVNVLLKELSLDTVKAKIEMLVSNDVKTIGT